MTEEQTLDSLETSGGGGDETDAFRSLTTLANALCKQQEEDALELQRQQQQQSRRLHRSKTSQNLHQEAAITNGQPDLEDTKEKEIPKQTEVEEIELQVISGSESEITQNKQDVIEEAPCSPTKPEACISYLSEDNLQTHIKRHVKILQQVLGETCTLPDVQTLTEKYEKEIFAPGKVPQRGQSGTCEKDPRLNFTPPFLVPELLATYHVFFQNTKVPFSCKANRTNADEALYLDNGANLPVCPCTGTFPKIFDGLGESETPAPNALENPDSVLVELKGDNPRLAVLKRSICVSHFAYPAVSLPPKVMSVIMENLICKKISPQTQLDDDNQEPAYEDVVSDEQLAKWLGLEVGDKEVEDRKKTMTAVVLITCLLQCMEKFFTTGIMFKKLEENVHYLFKHGYVKLACEVSNVELTNLVSYMGILHENRLGQNVLHSTLQGESRRDYIRDTIYLYLVYTWQSAMGVWQQCLQDSNLKELAKLLKREKKNLWTGFDETTIAVHLRDIIFPPKLVEALQEGLPDFASQSQMQNFRSFILERSGVVPSMCTALPTDFVPLTYRECPPNLWPYTYIMKLSNYIMFHSDVAFDLTGPGLMSCYCRCNLCTPHRCLAVNNALLNEKQTIGTFELQRPPKPNGETSPPLKLTAGMWASALLKKFVAEDYHPREIQFYEDQSGKCKMPMEACVITQAKILAQLQDIKKAREDFLLKKGRGVYLDPQSGERLDDCTPPCDTVADDGASTGRPSTPYPAKKFGSKTKRKARRRNTEICSPASPSEDLQKVSSAARRGYSLKPRRGTESGNTFARLRERCGGFTGQCLRASSPGRGAEEAPLGSEKNT